MRKIYLILALVCMAHVSFSQLRMAILGGGHSASINEQNSIPSWETTIKPGYSSKGGLHLGILVNVPISANNRWNFQPGILYTEKGRKFYMRNDTATSITTDTISAAHTVALNYIDIPLNLTYKLPLSKKANFFLSAGPYISFFYNGKQKNETRIYSLNSFKDEDVRLESGNGAGRYQTFDYGWNARAGFEIGSGRADGARGHLRVPRGPVFTRPLTRRLRSDWRWRVEGHVRLRRERRGQRQQSCGRQPMLW